MFSRIWTNASTKSCSEQIERLKTALRDCDAVVVGAGAGLSTSAGFVYTGERFEKNFSDFAAKYGFRDMYSGGFYPFATPEEHWAYWSRYIYINRYMDAPKPIYDDLLKLVADKDYFVITTNVDHCFQKAGFEKKQLFYTQGDYGLFQCSEPCCQETFDNEAVVREMVARQENMKIPSELLPVCPHCGKPMTMNLRSDDAFVEDEGWHRAAERYADFLRTRKGQKNPLSGAGRRLQHAGHHQISILADDSQEPQRNLRLHQSGTGICPGRNCKSLDCGQRRHRQDIASNLEATDNAAHSGVSKWAAAHWHTDLACKV